MKENRHENGVVFFTSDKIATTHAFSTRIGGVSTNEHTKSLNLAFGRGDGDDTVRQNLHRYAEAVGFCEKNIVSVPQIHSNKVVYVNRDMCGEGYYKSPSLSCDGYVTREKGIALGIKTADCVPILLYDEKNGVIGALHAGWRGTFSCISANGVELMCRHGAEKESIVAVIGSCICKNCYEVGREVLDSALMTFGERALDFFSLKENGKYLADIANANKYILLSCGIRKDNIEIIPLCTYENPELFWSHRYTNGKRGTMLNIIELK